MLSSEVFVHPPELLAADPQTPSVADPSSPQWWVLHTRPRAEKALARRLLARSVGFFLPQYERRWLSRGRPLSSHLPLFPGYLFLHGDEPGRVAALETNLVVNCLRVTDQQRLREDLDRVYRLMNSEAPLTPEEHLAAGDWVEIIEGALMGLQGRVTRCGKNLRFTVEVRFLQQGVSVEVERWMIRPLPEGAALAGIR
ncbi:MAG TPA: transcription termination/antitermination NusG family protein [Myxococcaceae bacterium]|nr:transcription termination/antitermination NusG family protein [Myxococcaceae bacterium]